jgi:hypothetical protein
VKAAPESAEMRIAAAARLEILRSIERRGRVPDCGELARAIEAAVRRELFEAELAGELRTSRQYCLVLERILPAERRR